MPDPDEQIIPEDEQVPEAEPEEKVESKEDQVRPKANNSTLKSWPPKPT